MHIIDILLMSGSRGGLENVVNSVAIKLKESGYRVRIIQLVYAGVNWVSEGIEYYANINNKAHTVNDFVNTYRSFLTSHAFPDIVLATQTPRMSYIAKTALTELGLETTVIGWPHGSIEEYEKNGAGGMECLAYADGFFTITNKVAKQLKKEFPQKFVKVVFNPVDIANAKIKNNEWAKDNRQLIFVGRISAVKRLDIIIEALKKAEPKWRLAVVGDGDEKAKCIELANQLCVSDMIEWRGWKEEPWEDTRDVTALVVASDHEGFCLVAVEAMARGIPVISTPVDGIVEYLIPGVNGFIYEKGNSDSLADVLDAISDGILHNIDPKGCAETVKKFEKECVLNNFISRVEEILHKNCRVDGEL